jgi:hypothetical protein
MATKKELEEQIVNLQINLEYATRIVWLIVNNEGGNYEITKQMIEEAQFGEVRISDTVSGGLYIEVGNDEQDK